MEDEAGSTKKEGNAVIANSSTVAKQADGREKKTNEAKENTSHPAKRETASVGTESTSAEKSRPSAGRQTVEGKDSELTMPSKTESSDRHLSDQSYIKRVDSSVLIGFINECNERSQVQALQDLENCCKAGVAALAFTDEEAKTSGPNDGSDNSNQHHSPDVSIKRVDSYWKQDPKVQNERDDYWNDMVRVHSLKELDQTSNTPERVLPASAASSPSSTTSTTSSPTSSPRMTKSVSFSKESDDVVRLVDTAQEVVKSSGNDKTVSTMGKPLKDEHQSDTSGQDECLDREEGEVEGDETTLPSTSGATVGQRLINKILVAVVFFAMGVRMESVGKTEVMKRLPILGSLLTVTETPVIELNERKRGFLGRKLFSKRPSEAATATNSSDDCCVVLCTFIKWC